jgi:hypothetical protein
MCNMYKLDPAAKPVRSPVVYDDGTECARNRDLYELVSCHKYWSEILFVSFIKKTLSYLGASCPRCDFVLVP